MPAALTNAPNSAGLGRRMPIVFDFPRVAQTGAGPVTLNSTPTPVRWEASATRSNRFQLPRG